ncbi:MAG: DUF6567 family protein [Bacteroidota bacterium]
MKTIAKTFKGSGLTLVCTMLLLGLLTSSCGVGAAITENQNQNSTQVHLTTNNFTTIGNASGSAEANYVFSFGGWKKRNLYGQAYQNMLDAAQLNQGSRAVINVVTEEFVGGFPPFFTKRQITVSAQVIEFN